MRVSGVHGRTVGNHYSHASRTVCHWESRPASDYRYGSQARSGNFLYRCRHPEHVLGPSSQV